MYEDNFSPEQIERLSDALYGDDAHLVSDLQAVYQPLAESHAHSLERVRTRLAQQEVLNRISQPPQQKQLEEKIITIRDLKIMEDKNVSWGMNSSTPLSQAKKHGSIMRTAGISLIAAVAIITIISFTIFSGVLRPAPQTSGKGSTTITAAQPAQQSQQRKTISNGKLVCSVGFDDRPLPPFTDSSAQANWPIQGKIVANYTGGSTIFSAQDCGAKKALPAEVYEAIGSPDGKKIATASLSTNMLNVLDSNGNTIKSISFPNLGVVTVGEMAWSSDSTKLTFLAEEANHVDTIKSFDVSNGNVKTAIKVDGNGGTKGFIYLSPTGKYAIMSGFNVTTKQKDMAIWDVNTGKKVADLPSNNGQGNSGGLAFSSDSSLIAVGRSNQIHIFRSTDGKLVNTLDYKDANGFAWSPDDRYLAVYTTSISIYDVNAKKLVTTFGKVNDPAKQKIAGLAWSPDGTGLVSSIEQPDDGHSPTPVNVWALS